MTESFRGAIPNDRLYDPEYDMWVLPDEDGRMVTLGATAWGIHLAGKIIGFTSKPRGAQVEAGRSLGTVESAKTVIAIHSPLGCVLVAGNEATEGNPDLLNRDPYGDGWMVKARPEDLARDMSRLIDAKRYKWLIRRADPAAEFL